jgi:hypothetical protein
MKNTILLFRKTFFKQTIITTTLHSKDKTTRTPLKTGGDPRCSGKVSSTGYTSGTHCITLVTNPIISH